MSLESYENRKIHGPEEEEEEAIDVKDPEGIVSVKEMTKKEKGQQKKASQRELTFFLISRPDLIRCGRAIQMLLCAYRKMGCSGGRKVGRGVKRNKKLNGKIRIISMLPSRRFISSLLNISQELKCLVLLDGSPGQVSPSIFHRESALANVPFPFTIRRNILNSLRKPSILANSRVTCNTVGNSFSKRKSATIGSRWWLADFDGWMDPFFFLSVFFSGVDVFCLRWGFGFYFFLVCSSLCRSARRGWLVISDVNERRLTDLI